MKNLININLVLNNYCSAKCPYCNQQSYANKMPSKETSKETVERFLKGMDLIKKQVLKPPYDRFQITLLGGELCELEYEDQKIILDELKDFDDVTLLTNGIQLKESAFFKEPREHPLSYYIHIIDWRKKSFFQLMKRYAYIGDEHGVSFMTVVEDESDLVYVKQITESQKECYEAGFYTGRHISFMPNRPGWQYQTEDVARTKVERLSHELPKITSCINPSIPISLTLKKVWGDERFKDFCAMANSHGLGVNTFDFYRWIYTPCCGYTEGFVPLDRISELTYSHLREGCKFCTDYAGLRALEKIIYLESNEEFEKEEFPW